MTKLSHSAKDKITTCGALYKLHYVDKIRPTTISSALFYGKALDEAFSAMLVEKMSPPPPIMECPHDVFNRHFDYVEINGERVSTLDTRCVYFKGDLDPELCSYPDRATYLSSNYQTLEGELLIEFNKLTNESLRNKAKLLINSYQEEVLPKIERVYSIQEEVNLPNDEGDEIVGFIDFICSFVDEPGVQYIVDNKTSSKNYKEDSVRTSEQLATYCDYKLIDKAAYIVLNKTLRKKDPKVNVQIIRDTIPNEMFEKVFDTYANALYTIRSGDYRKNFSSGCFFFGKKCSYFDYCRSGSMDRLIKVNGDKNGKS